MTSSVADVLILQSLIIEIVPVIVHGIQVPSAPLSIRAALPLPGTIVIVQLHVQQIIAHRLDLERERLSHSAISFVGHLIFWQQLRIKLLTVD
jgi:hypothetical protein